MACGDGERPENAVFEDRGGLSQLVEDLEEVRGLREAEAGQRDLALALGKAGAGEPGRSLRKVRGPGGLVLGGEHHQGEPAVA